MQICLLVTTGKSIRKYVSDMDYHMNALEIADYRTHYVDSSRTTVTSIQSIMIVISNETNIFFFLEQAANDAKFLTNCSA